MIEELTKDIRESIDALEALYAEKVTLLEKKAAANESKEELETIALLQGIGIDKSHGSNEAQRKAYLKSHLHNQAGYVAALNKVAEAEYALISVQEGIAFETKRQMAIDTQAKLLAMAQTQSNLKEVAGL